MTLDARSQTILRAALESYIKTGEPVSSAWLFDHYHFGIKPAMIRHELNYLEEEGYLMQPHHSAGRVPTNKAYELYVRELLNGAETGGSLPQVQNKAVHPAKHPSSVDYFKARAWDALVSDISKQLGVLGVAWDSASDEVYADGLHNVVAGISAADARDIVQIVYDFEQLHQTFARVVSGIPPDDISVFVGRGNPVIASEEVSAIVTGYDVGRDRTVYVCAIGPKRMDYSKAIRFLTGLKN